MTRAICLVLVAGLFGCSKKDACEAKRNAAADSVVNALSPAEIARDDAKAKVDEAQRSFHTLDDGEQRLTERLKLFEQSMDCLVYKNDCCKRLAKIDGSGRTQIWSSLSEVHSKLGVSVPHEIDAVLAPLHTLDDAAEDLITAKPKEAEKFCTDARQQIARVRKDAPPAWTAAREAIKADVATRKSALEAAQRRLTAVGEWADAIRKNTKATIAPDLGADAEQFARARESVTAYNAACH
jgi:hypothetical protein